MQGFAAGLSACCRPAGFWVMHKPCGRVRPPGPMVRIDSSIVGMAVTRREASCGGSGFALDGRCACGGGCLAATPWCAGVGRLSSFEHIQANITPPHNGGLPFWLRVVRLLLRIKYAAVMLTLSIFGNLFVAFARRGVGRGSCESELMWRCGCMRRPLAGDGEAPTGSFER